MFLRLLVIKQTLKTSILLNVSHRLLPFFRRDFLNILLFFLSRLDFIIFNFVHFKIVDIIITTEVIIIIDNFATKLFDFVKTFVNITNSFEDFSNFTKYSEFNYSINSFN